MTRPNNPTPRHLSTKLQFSGYRFSIARVVGGFIRRNTRDQESPTSKHSTSVSIGAVVIVLSLVAGFVMHKMKPNPEHGVSAIMISKSGGLYVSFNGKINPVTNLASARLITGKDDEASMVSDNVLQSLPRGPLMGIPSGPNNLGVWQDTTSDFAVCDTIDHNNTLSLQKSGDTTLSVIAGARAFSSRNTLENRGLIVRSSSDESKLWIIYGNTRAEIGEKDYATQSALGINPEMVTNAAILDSGFVDAIPPSPIFTLPNIAGRGKPSNILNKALIGTVATISTARDQRIHYIVLRDGIMRIGDVFTQMLLNTGSDQTTYSNSEDVTSLPEVNEFDVSRFPNVAPDFITPDTTCMRWTRRSAEANPDIVITVDKALPITDQAREDIQPTIPAVGDIVQADSVVTLPGKGWYVRTTDNGYTNIAQEGTYYIDDTGVRYGIGLDPVDPQANSPQRSIDKTVKSLGLSYSDPLPIPWSILKLFPQGSSLSLADALVEHDDIKRYDQGRIAHKNS